MNQKERPEEGGEKLLGKFSACKQGRPGSWHQATEGEPSEWLRISKTPFPQVIRYQVNTVKHVRFCPDWAASA